MSLHSRIHIFQYVHPWMLTEWYRLRNAGDMGLLRHHWYCPVLHLGLKRCASSLCHPSPKRHTRLRSYSSHSTKLFESPGDPHHFELMRTILNQQVVENPRLALPVSVVLILVNRANPRFDVGSPFCSPLSLLLLPPFVAIGMSEMLGRLLPQLRVEMQDTI